MSKKREEYVVDRLESLLDLIEGVYETSDDFLIAPDYLEVQQVIKSIRTTHTADTDVLSRLNKTWKKNKLMEKHQPNNGTFYPFDKCIKLEVESVYNEGQKNGHENGYDEAFDRYKEVWQCDKHPEPDDKAVENILNQWGIIDELEDGDDEEECDGEEEYDDLPF